MGGTCQLYALQRQDYDRAPGFGLVPGLRIERTQACIELASLVELGHLGWQLDSIVLDPPASRRAAARSQALVVEPPMLTHLERGVKEAFARQDPRWEVGWWAYRGTTLSPHPESSNGEAVPLYAVLPLPARQASEQTRRFRFLHSFAVHRWLRKATRGPARWGWPVLQPGRSGLGHLGSAGGLSRAVSRFGY